MHSGYNMYHLVYHSKTSHFPHTVYLYVAWDSQTTNGFPLKDSMVGRCAGGGVFTVRYELSFYLLCRRNTCLKDYKLEDVTNGDPD